MTAVGYASTTGDTRKVNKSGDTMTGELTLPDSSPDQALNAASKGYVDTVAATKAALAHAAQHAAAGSDPVTLTQAQITGLVAALAALLPLAGGTITGALTIQGYTTLNGGQFNSDFAAFGNMTLIGTGKRIRFRRDGAKIDVEGGGTDAIVSVWSGEDFTGTQHTYLRLESGTTLAHACGTWIFTDTPDSGAVHTLDGTGNKLGFHGATSIAQQTVTGSRGGNAALASLLTKLATLGLIVDGTSA